jgi:hypothetical protein
MIEEFLESSRRIVSSIISHISCILSSLIRSFLNIQHLESRFL